MTSDELREAVARAICYERPAPACKCKEVGSCQALPEVLLGPYSGMTRTADAAIRVALGAAREAIAEQERQPLFNASERSACNMCLRAIAALMPKETSDDA